MSLHDRRSQRIRDQLRTHPNPRSGQAMTLARSFQDQLRRVYIEERSETTPQVNHTAELARLGRRRR